MIRIKIAKNVQGRAYKVRPSREPLFPRVAKAAHEERHANPRKRKHLVAPHEIQRQQDEMFCARCSRRWPVGEEAPSACAPRFTR